MTSAERPADNDAKSHRLPGRSRIIQQLTPLALLAPAVVVVGFFSPRLGIALLAGAAVGAAIGWVATRVVSARAKRAAQAPARRRPLVKAALFLIAVAAVGLSAAGIALRSPGPGLGPSSVREISAKYVGTVVYHSGAWNVRNELVLGPNSLVQAAKIFTGARRRPSQARARIIVARRLRPAGWILGPLVDENTYFVHTSPPQKRNLRWFPLTTSVDVRLRTAAPDPDDPVIVAGAGSVVYLDVPKRMVQATFPPLGQRADKLNGRDGITVPLDVAGDSPPTALRIRASNALGRNVVVAWMLTTLSAKWEAWLFAFLGAAVTLFRKRIKAAFDTWRRKRPRPAPPHTPPAGADGAH